MLLHVKLPLIGSGFDEGKKLERRGSRTILERREMKFLEMAKMREGEGTRYVCVIRHGHAVFTIPSFPLYLD